MYKAVFIDIDGTLRSTSGEISKRNIDLKETIAIGDNNDISMFKGTGYGVAMENATDKLKEIANEIASSNNENGVALFLEKLINIL